MLNLHLQASAVGGMTCPTGGAAPCVILHLSVKPTREDCEPEPIDATPPSAPAMFGSCWGQSGSRSLTSPVVLCQRRARSIGRSALDDLEKRGQIFGVGDDAGTRRRCDGIAQARRITDLPKTAQSFL